MSAPALQDYAYASSDAVNHSHEIPGGSVDVIADDAVAGWCVDPQAPQYPVRLELRLHDLLVAEFSTLVERPDIARCFGVERGCGYSFDLFDLHPDLARQAVALHGERLEEAPRDRADLRVTVKGQRVELPRWHTAGTAFFNANLLYMLRSSYAPEPIGWFDAAWYKAENPVVASLAVDPFRHYRERGWREGRPPNRVVAAKLGKIGIKPYNSLAGSQAGLCALIAESGLFEAGWYSERYGISQDHAVAHYVSTGAFRGQDPSPFFSSLDYLGENLDSAKAGCNPLAHLILRGMAEGRATAKGAVALRLTANDWLKGL